MGTGADGADRSRAYARARVSAVPDEAAKDDAVRRWAPRVLLIFEG